MIGVFMSSVLPKCWLVPIERRRSFFIRYPILWNAANIISASRVLMFLAVLLLPYFQQDSVVAWYVVLSFSDKIDGWVALLTGNNDGIGKVIDPVCDKVFHFMGLQYLLLGNLLDPALLGYLAMLFEGLTFFVGFACVHCVWTSEGESIAKSCAIIKEKMADGIRVNPFGKAKMVAYFAGIFFLLLYHYLPRFWTISAKEQVVLKNLYVIFFSFGIFMAAIAFSLYVYEAVRWWLHQAEQDPSA
jgi:phosphatidylglycerophosphate synthase